MKTQDQFKEHYQQFLYALHTYPQAIKFLVKHKLWSGFWKYSWVSKLLLLAAILLGLKFIDSVTNLFRNVDTSDPLAAMSTAGTMMFNIIGDEIQYLSTGSMRYLMLILLEVVIFHVCRRTIAILTNQDSQASMKAFIDAQVRMIKIVIYCYVMEMIFGMGIKFFFNIFDALDFLQPAILFIISLFFIGYTVMDNYFEQFGMSIKNSLHFSKQYIGLALGIGLVIQVLFMVPVAGTLLAPMIAAVTVSIALYELTDLHLQTDEPLLIEAELV